MLDYTRYHFNLAGASTFLLTRHVCVRTRTRETGMCLCVRVREGGRGERESERESGGEERASEKERERD